MTRAEGEIAPQDDRWPHLADSQTGELLLGRRDCEHAYRFYEGFEGVYGVCHRCDFHHWQPSAAMLEGQEIVALLDWTDDEIDEVST